jgi:de-etiolated-1
MSFISSYANNSFVREQFRKEKDACLAGKIGSYTQVESMLLILEHDNSNLSRVI